MLHESFQAMREVRPDIAQVIVGDGPGRAQLEKALPDAHFTGFVGQEALARHYASADLFIFPSLSETWGNVVAEAMASGLAVVAYDHAASAELINSGHNGITVPAGNSAAFQQAAVDLCQHPADYARLGRVARLRALEQSWMGIAEQFCITYTKPWRLIMRPRPLVVFDRLDLLEWQFCQRISRLSIYRPWRITLQAASRLGDWPVWVLLILAQPWLQPNSAWRLMQYSVIALFAVAVYRLVKTRLCRERPFITYKLGIQCCEPARDRYSFPSGHTMHAVMFSVLVATHTPWLLPYHSAVNPADCDLPSRPGVALCQ
ncbi:hypothetical protein HSBAA_03820 [Vreelandella sulfidaeris]|uniref:Phosphatidic acid phosphatase type 2/haloperoxidase domain-containing protein n=1 Tax=Vreelandella sulfidaeris TaxID=115553 RepID=A0A455TZV6_9GAMM|nr:hypothetical protein HSBAA_03820 [Halomonas sulfidaeris]